MPMNADEVFAKYTIAGTGIEDDPYEAECDVCGQTISYDYREDGFVNHSLADCLKVLRRALESLSGESMRTLR